MGLFRGFLANYGKNAILDAKKSLNDAIVRFDPEGASEAEIAAIEEQFDQVNREYSRAKSEFQKERKEADAILALRDKRMAAAEMLAGKVEADPTDTVSAQGLEQLLSALEDMQEEIDREVEEANDAEEIMNELDQTVKLYADKLKSARSDMRKAAMAMEKARRQEERAEEKARRAAVLAGLKKDTSSLGSALESMNRQAEEAQAKADAAKRKADLLGKSSVDENDAVAAAMAAVSGEKPAPTSAAERLAALRNKQ